MDFLRIGSVGGQEGWIVFAITKVSRFGFETFDDIVSCVSKPALSFNLEVGVILAVDVRGRLCGG